MTFLKPMILAGVLLFILVLAGCDTSAQSEMEKAQEALDKALDAGADQHASKVYEKSQELLIEAAYLARNNKIQEARAAATKSKRLAEDAAKKALEHSEALSRESEKVGRGY